MVQWLPAPLHSKNVLGLSLLACSACVGLRLGRLATPDSPIGVKVCEWLFVFASDLR